MNTNKKNNNGWILCSSKTFPGKFYYFNVVNGEAVWSPNDTDKKDLHKLTTIADKFHNYPEPTSMPDENTIGPQVTCHIVPNFKKPNIVRTIPCPDNHPTFGKTAFPNYVANTGTLIPNIVWTPVQLPMPMFCPETKRPMSDKITQTSELERQLIIQTSDIPLCKRFKNYEDPSLGFENNKVVNKRIYYFDTSTPKSSDINNRTQPLNHIPKSNFQFKQPILKLESELPDTKTPEIIKNNSKSTLSLGNRVESTNMDNPVPKLAENEKGLSSLDRSDLRFLLLAKRRKSVDATEEEVVERKKAKPEVATVTPKKKVTFDLSQDLSDISDDTILSDTTAQENFTPLTSEHTYIETPKDLPTKCQQKDTVVQIAPVKDTWYIVVDTDVLLLDKEFIEELVLSDNKCKLLIPYAVRADVAALCVSDCGGQQRVINARQITRRLATPPPHYIVEPDPDHMEDIVVTIDSILQCCVNAVNQNHYVVLITNDPYLQAKASSLHIPNYKLNEIKKDLNAKPDMTSELTKLKIRIQNDDSIKNDMFIQNKNNLSPFSNKSHGDNVKKQLFLNNDNDIELDCDKLINITKPKSLKNNYYYSNCDSDIDIDKNMKNLNLKERHILRSQNENRNPFFNKTVCKNSINKDGSTNFEKMIQTSNPVFKQSDFEKTVHDSKLDVKNTFSKSNRDIPNFEKESCMKDTESIDNIIYSNPISNIKKMFQYSPNTENYSKSKIRENFDISFNTELPNESYETSRETRIPNATQSRLKKIFNNINFDSTKNQLENQEEISKTNDSTGIFKVPQPVQFKNRTRKPAPDLNDKIRTRELKNTDWATEILKRFCVKSKVMSKKLSSRMDEWICSYTQIMEDVLNQILQDNSECMKDTVAPLTLHDTLNCIKMLYDSHTKVRDAVDNTSDLINRCYKKGKHTPSLNPDQFMIMFGYGVHLILSLEEIIPHSEELKDAGTRLCSLLANIESNTVELDPELLKTPYVSSTDVDARDEELRPNFSKEPSYIIDYLKKHYKAWTLCNEDTFNNNTKSQNHSNVKVVRTLGKNINLLKFDSSKIMSVSKSTVEADSTKKCEERPEIISSVQVNKHETDKNENINTIEMKESGPKLTKLLNKGQNIFLKNRDNLNDGEIIKSKYFPTENVTEQESHVLKVMNKINKTSQNLKKTQNIVEVMDFPNAGHTFMQGADSVGPKVIRNMKLIDEYEKRIINKESLDLDLLDYSEIYEPSITENLQSDNVRYNSDNSEGTTANNYNENNSKSTLTDFTEDLNLGKRNKVYMSPILESKNYSFTFKKKMMDKMNGTNPKIEPNNDNYGNDVTINNETTNNGSENDTYNDNIVTNNDSCIDIDISEIHNDIDEIHNDISDFHNDISGIRKDNDKFEKLAQVRDDSTNDSGFENDSTYAHSVVKIFLNDLSTSFKVIYEFVNKFIVEIHDIQSCELRKNNLHNQASKSLEDLAAIIQRLRSIIKRESAEDTVLRTLLLKAGVEATTDKRMTRYKQIVMKSLEQAQILENALKIIASTTRGDFDFEVVSTNAHSVTSSKVAIKYFNIFEQP